MLHKLHMCMVFDLFDYSSNIILGLDTLELFVLDARVIRLVKITFINIYVGKNAGIILIRKYTITNNK